MNCTLNDPALEDLAMLTRRRLLACTLALPAAPTLATLLAPDEVQAREGKVLDVPFVPTPMAVVDAMLDMAKVGKDDLLYDLGSGDGRIVIRAAERFGCRGVGVDLNPERVTEARAAAKKAGARIEALVRFEEGDVFTFDFAPATVVTMYLLPSVNVKLRPRILKELKPGTRIVSHDFDMGEWKAEETRKVGNSTVYRWTVMANPPANLLR
jgi:SAM-dependent methyltransferase